MAPLHHLFDDHRLCNPSWYHKQKREVSLRAMNKNKIPIDATASSSCVDGEGSMSLIILNKLKTP